MINVLINFDDEERALMELEPFGYSRIVADPEDETGTEVIYAWNQGTAMVGGTSVILSYKGSTTPGPDGEPIPINVPTLAPGFWVSLLAREPDETFWEQMSANYPIIEFGLPEELPDPVVPSAFVIRSANLELDFNIDTIKGISPIWSGMPDMGFPYDG